MPRLFTGIEIPAEIGLALSGFRGGLPGARWVDPENYHLTLRFIGDIDERMADDVTSILGERRQRAPLVITIDGLDTFGGGKPRAVFARVAGSGELNELQAEQERLVRQAGLPPETRRFTPHVTLARLRNVSPGDVADYIATRGHFPKLTFTSDRFVLYSSRASVGGGPYIVEAAYPLS
ncbi:RNA 2',3'-cyclic phosphodiesterase [Microvirga mediterraneensis]|uniref:RNA 2',3'-cyclic phosphodiesterase n=1 Tax=Microvirga mediterraneensis TaxID=2754695 RepID=A0A838BKQ8_9HYPH|nr:RNA 2',3'-cyclic phosphodiesterase [Microvirga mediterraneensis]MBA1155076.1 RNA 2',3'-cyclic phosphodiesterase [Microvirga mediterraneensis]